MPISIERVGRLEASDWRLLAGATLLQLLTACALRVMSLPALRNVSARLRPLAMFLLNGSEERAIWAVEASGRRLGRFSTCLVRAIIVDLRFGSAERPLRLMIGVRRAPQGRVESHAWLEDRRRILVGGPAAGFVTLVAWDSLPT